MEEKKTQLGFTENTEAALCYALTWLSGIVFLVLEKESLKVRFHAIQAIIAFVAIGAIGLIAGVIPVVGPVLNVLVGIGAFILWIYLIVKTYNGEKVVLPVAGEIAEKMAKKTEN